jgi:hypothetical protein
MRVALTILFIFLASLLFIRGDEFVAMVSGLVGALIGGTLLPIDRALDILVHAIQALITATIGKLFSKPETKPLPQVSNQVITQTGTTNIASSTIGTLVIGNDGSIQTAFSFQNLIGTRDIPSLPEYYVERTAVVLELVGEINRQAGQSQAGFTYCMVGLGGTGKSLLANSFVRSEGVTTFSKDGITWAQIGPAFDSDDHAFSLLGEWVARLGLDPKDLTSLDLRIKAIKSHLAGKKIIFVLDDVWHTEPIKRIMEIDD